MKTPGRPPVERRPRLDAPGGRSAPPDPPTDFDPCPYCDTTAGVQPITSNPKVQAWSCTACGTQWAISVVNPRPYVDRLTATVVLRQLTALADKAPTLTNAELRARLVALALCVR